MNPGETLAHRHYGRSTHHPDYPPSLGARLQGDGRCRFRVWAPKVQQIELHLPGREPPFLPMEPRERGYYELVVDGVRPGTRYAYRLDGTDLRPDPASHFQPEGVHKPSCVVDPRFAWTDQDWPGLPFSDYIIYELHVGTFTAEGTFDAVIPHLDELKDLGITAVEIMPVAQFPGDRNWGYDGACHFAVQNSYGGPDGLRRLVDACHTRGMAVILDVVYNHFGPEGNYTAQFGRYFNSRHRTPWGDSINFEGQGSDEVRRFFIENALYWITEHHIDALRLDAVHAIIDQSARPFLRELSSAIRLQGELVNRRVYSIAESNTNDPRLTLPAEAGGLGMDAQWSDDFHHCLHVQLTGETDGYYADFARFEQFAKAWREGFVFSGDYSAYRGRRHGADSRSLAPPRHVVCAQNHDQTGNRMLGERLSQIIGFEKLKLAAGLVLLSPYTPMLFMGEEYGETAPFLYFVSHGDPDLVQAVRRGRRDEFVSFDWKEEPPDPQSVESFRRSRLNHALRLEGSHRLLWEFHQALIRMRRTLPPLAVLSRDHISIFSESSQKLLAVRRHTTEQTAVCLFNLSDTEQTASVPVPAGVWTKELDSAEDRWNGPGSPLPERIESSGRATLRIGPHALAVYSRGSSEWTLVETAGP